MGKAQTIALPNCDVAAKGNVLVAAFDAAGVKVKFEVLEGQVEVSWEGAVESVKLLDWVLVTNGPGYGVVPMRMTGF
jgi:hypothetical protein